ncbi:MAG: hypothetical protein R6U04_00260 [Bacteroidales bacterium]
MKKKYRNQHHKRRENGTHSWDRAKEADNSKIESTLNRLWRAISQGVKVDYVFIDSWFTGESLVKAVRRVKKQVVHLTGMYKIPKTRFNYLGQEITYSQIKNKLGKVNRCRKLKLHYMEALEVYNGVPIKIFSAER